MNPATTVVSTMAIGADRLEEATPRQTAATERVQVSAPHATEPVLPGAEVLGMQLVDGVSREPVRLAIDLDFLRKHPLYTFSRSTQQVVDPDRIGTVVITSPGGAFRVYQILPNHFFPDQPFGPTFVDDKGLRWRMAEEDLTNPIHFLRLPATRVSWLAWHEYFPDSLAIK